ncbi:UDP-N-acetylmuramoyl-tripeptide--D-alanyl-D-alanine ligase [Gudongella sp. SC589]|uniref:UDP-N-acetylmuramoyl-tripeptide--D-alanyl-D- alanine ligase n=1 Tax=Gudongella sp. SC589 TaxID=3385990 RepID=UPI003904B445
MSLIIISIFILVATISVQLMSKRTKDSLHMVQLEGYLADHYLKWLSMNKKKAYSLSGNEAPIKKPLVMTQRATRLFRANFIISAVFVALPSILVYSVTSNLIMGVGLLVVAMAAVYYYQPLVMVLSTMVMKPIEDNINMGYYRAAQNKVKSRENLEVVGVTGSFGKTSTKFIVGTILSQRFNVLNTPESYNTPMGLSKVINNDLSDEHEVFVAEMGAKKIGEIREVAQLAQPRIGILTSIGPVHMDTYKNIDNIMKTKYELIEALPTDGIAVFNYDNEYVKKLADKTFKEKMLYGLENVEELDIYAEDIVVNEKGSEFTLRDKEGNSVRCKTRLLGKHNIYNLLAGACASKILGLSFEEISMGIEKIEPVEHRLNLIESANGVIIIDDAFNSNPVGTKAALEVLSQFREGRKIIVTPGMIELGEMEESANREFGVNIGKVCDYVILVGEQRTKPIYEGLMETSFNPSNIFVVNNLQEATEEIGKITKPKDVVLFENDLPDNYSE